MITRAWIQATIRHLLVITTLGLLLLTTSAYANQSVTILTSFPESFYQPVIQAYQKQTGRNNLLILNKKTPAIITHLQQNRTPAPDLVWLSSLDAMILLQQQGFLQSRELNGSGDRQAYYDTFAWSQFGFIWHKTALAQQGITPPKNWSDLLSSQYQQRLAISAPSRSGTNHLLVELVLQQYGWQKGWTLLQQFAGNLATITARSFGVREGILKQRFSVAPVVDFFYRSALAQGHNVGFQPMPNTPLIAAAIALVNTSRSQENASHFIEFLLSEPGQKAISQPGVNRIPLAQKQKLQGENVFQFDPALSASRYHVVNTLFDQLITHQLKQHNQFWPMWQALSEQTQAEDISALLKRAKHNATLVPVDETVASDPELNQRLSPAEKHSDFYQRLSEQWRSNTRLQLEKASHLVLQASNIQAGKR